MTKALQNAEDIKALFGRLTDDASIFVRDNVAYDSSHVPPLPYGMAPGEASVASNHKAKSTVLTPEDDAKYTPIIGALTETLRGDFDHTHVVFSEFPDGKVKLTVSQTLIDRVNQLSGSRVGSVSARRDPNQSSGRGV